MLKIYQGFGKKKGQFGESRLEKEVAEETGNAVIIILCMHYVIFLALKLED